jgi:DNA mismatch repair protein MSH2
MAQVGSFVPCTSATLPVFRNVMCRVGASDLQLRGISTFMSEMLEASAILKAVSKESLVVVDELGRGTSTYDGYGLAHSIAKHLTKVGCFTLFATHFHEMSRLANEMPQIRNAHMRATVNTNPATDKKTLVFLYEVADGPTDQSYGVEVAEMVKFPEEVLRQAKRKAEELGEISGRHMKQLRKLTPEQLEAVERIKTAKSAEEFAQLTRAELPILQTIACA